MLLEPKMQNIRESQQDNQQNASRQTHKSSAKITGESFDVNENDVRDQDQPDTDASQACHEESAKIVGESFDVNENDVRDQDRP